MEGIHSGMKGLLIALLLSPTVCLAHGAGPGGGGGAHGGGAHGGAGGMHGAFGGGPHGAPSGRFSGGGAYSGRYGGGNHIWRGGYPGGYGGGYGGGWRRNRWDGAYFGGGLIYGGFYDPWSWPSYSVDYAPSPLMLEAPVMEEAPPADPVYRFFCPTTRDYYPAVQTCTVPWLRVVPGG